MSESPLYEWLLIVLQCSDIENRSKAEVARSAEDALQARTERDELTRNHKVYQQEVYQAKQDLAVLAVSVSISILSRSLLTLSC